MERSPYKRLFKLVLYYWPLLIVSTIAAFIYVILNSLSLWLMASLINNILTDFDKLLAEHNKLAEDGINTANEALKYWTNNLILKDTPMETLATLCGVILITFVLKNVFLFLKNTSIAYMRSRLIQHLRNKLYEHLHTLNLAYFNKIRSGELTSIIINDVANMRHALATSFQKLFVEPINIATMIALLFIISWKLATIAVIIVPVTGIIIIGVGRSIRRKSHRTAVKIAGITNIISEALTSIRVVKAFVMQTYEVERFKNETEKHFSLLFKRAFLHNLSAPITETLGVIIGVILLWYGGTEVINSGNLTSEDFLRFILILFSVFEPARRLGNVNMEMQMGIASSQRVFKIMDSDSIIEEVPDAIDISNFNDSIDLNNVGFHYSEDVGPVLSDISFKINKGEIVALVGHSGAGKSTVADLIPRFYDITSGSINIDNVDIRKVKINSLRGLMGIVTQETILFDDTIKNNIAYGDSSISLDQIKDAAGASNALEFIEKLPHGFNTVIGEKGVNLSGGQRQRIAIARALIKNPPILILDEATSSLDTESEKLVQNAIEKLIEDRTVIVIAHRLSTIVNASKIIVMKDGKVAESGSHDQLIALKGYYHNLYHIQLSEPK